MGMSRKKISENTVLAAESPQNESKPRPLESLREMVGLISAGAGIFAALLYLAGRSFASGYFAAMNIPHYQVSFSMWEYGEVAWRSMLFYPTLIIGVSALSWMILHGSWDLITYWLKKTFEVKLPNWLNPSFSKRTKQWFALVLFSVLVMSLIWFADQILQIVENVGKESGKIVVLERTARVELVSLIPMALDDDNLAPVKSSGQDYFTYKGLHLLTVNNGKYYLFKGIDPATCRPVKVYVVEDRENLQINLLPAVSIADQCKSITGQNTIPTSVTPTTNP
jgi:hypothetical protein